MITIVPAIIPYSKKQLEEEIKKVSSFAPLVQVDISDGIFTPSKTWPYNGQDLDFFTRLKSQEDGWPDWQKTDIEVHLMIKSPENVILDWINSGVSTIIAHIEATDNFQEIIDLCREKMISVGVAIKPSTEVSLLGPFASQVDFIQCMGNDLLGKHGVELDSKSILQIKELRRLYPERIIAIDIGVNEDTVDELVSIGVSKFISGGAILNAKNPEEEYERLENFQ